MDKTLHQLLSALNNKNIWNGFSACSTNFNDYGTGSYYLPQSSSANNIFWTIPANKQCTRTTLANYKDNKSIDTYTQATNQYMNDATISKNTANTSSAFNQEPLYDEMLFMFDF